jgi:hypothetical protein
MLLQPVADDALCLCCDVDGQGGVYERPDTLIWRCATVPGVRRTARLFGMYASLQMNGSEQGRSYTVLCEQRFPHTRYAILDGSSRRGCIRRSGLLRNHYDVDLVDGGSWHIHLPIFSIHITGLSIAGDAFHGRMARFDTWYVTLPAAVRSPALLAALLAIQRERHHA